jgi:hypothetical protein
MKDHQEGSTYKRSIGAPHDHSPKFPPYAFCIVRISIASHAQVHNGKSPEIPVLVDGIRRFGPSVCPPKPLKSLVLRGTLPIDLTTGRFAA